MRCCADKRTGKKAGERDKAGVYEAEQAPVADPRASSGIGPNQSRRRVQDNNQQQKREGPRGYGDIT